MSSREGPVPQRVEVDAAGHDVAPGLARVERPGRESEVVLDRLERLRAATNETDDANRVARPKNRSTRIPWPATTSTWSGYDVG